MTSWGLALLWLPAALERFSGANRSAAYLLWTLVILWQTLVPVLAAILHSLLAGKTGAALAFVLSMTAAGALVPVAIPYSPIAALHEQPQLLAPVWWGGRWCGAAFVFAANAGLGELMAPSSFAGRWLSGVGGARCGRLTSRGKVISNLGALTALWLGLHLAQTALLPAPARELRLLLVQADETGAGSSASTARRIRQHVELTEHALEEGAPDLIVWGETILAEPLAARAPSAPPGLEGALLRWSLPLVVGAVLRDGEASGAPSGDEAPRPAPLPSSKRLFNSVVLFPPGGSSACPGCRSDKRILVPGAEGILPLLSEGGASLPRGGRFTEGTARNLVLSGATLGPLICYEAIFGAAVLGRSLEGADLLLNVVSDGWIPEEGRASHRALATLAAVESGRALVRLAAGGPSTLTLPTGETEVLIDTGRAAARLVAVPIFTGATPLLRLLGALVGQP